MRNKGLIATIVVLIAVIITLIAVVFLMQMPTILSNDSWAGKFLNKKETTIVSTTETTETKKITYDETTVPLPKLTTKVENYTGYKDHVSIDYPQIVGLDDASMQEKLNNKIKTNALAIVPLYPISTAVQDLTISCEVKHLDEDYITIIYEGRVVGVKAGNSSSSSSSSSSNRKPSSNVPDPYLDGFVDPLTIWGQNINQANIMPTTGAPINYSVPTTENRAEVTYNTNQNNSVVPNSGATNTADKGPVVVDIKSPTAKRKDTFAVEQTASNNPTGNMSPIISNSYSANGVYYYGQSGTVAPVETSSGNSTTYSLPVSGFANTNASDIDQKIYFTNTINLKTGLDMRLGDYVKDFNALAKYLRSSKVEFANIDDSDRKAVREYVNKTVQSKYVEQMKAADFRNEGVTSWPKIFSYKDTDGTIYFSVKLSSKLGNYAIVKYKN
ncbi:MAG: hypothetical protein IKP66_00040 [Lachnospiraceae bacterium]|nr:hypothetical protein [Lachnospiraceae bacterium]